MPFEMSAKSRKRDCTRISGNFVEAMMTPRMMALMIGMMMYESQNKAVCILTYLILLS